MKPIEKKGQTALEYLLIVVVAIIVVVAVMVWMQGTTVETKNSASERTDLVLCQAKYCTVDANCAGIAPCPATATCDTTSNSCII